MTKRILNTALALLPLLLIGGCHPTIFQDMDLCKREIEVSLYSRTECATQRSYPAEIKSVLLVAYNEKGEVVATQTHEGALTADTKVKMSVPASELIRVSAWSGLDKAYFDVTATAPVKELFARLRANVDLKGRVVYHGMSGQVPLKPLTRKGDIQVTPVEVNMLELTNRVTVHITGLEEPEKVSLSVSSANDRYSGEGRILSTAQDSPYKYVTDVVRKPNTYVGPAEPGCAPEHNGELTATFTTLALESGHNSFVTIAKEGAEQPLSRNLLALILSAAKEGADINLRCDRDFLVELKVERCPECSEGYQVAWIKINNWLLHSYDTDLNLL